MKEKLKETIIWIMLYLHTPMAFIEHCVIYAIVKLTNNLDILRSYNDYNMRKFYNFAKLLGTKKSYEEFKNNDKESKVNVNFNED